jgi:DHA1 family inner membrane transport protein
MRSPLPTLLSLALGGLTIGTTEFAAMGLLPLIATGLGASIPDAGWTITAYALGVVVGAPLLTVLAARIDRKTLLVSLMSFYALANLASAFAPTLGWLVAGRFLAGLPHGAFFGVGSVVGAHVAGKEKRGWATSIMMAGLTIANLAGVPLVTWGGMVLGWRLSYVGVSALAAITVAAVALLTPRVPAHGGASVTSELSSFKSGKLWLAFASGAVGFGGMFAVYSYVAPLITEGARLPSGAVPWVLSLFGLGMTIGVLFAGRASDRSVRATALGGSAATAVVLLFIGTLGGWPAVAVTGMFLLGFATQFYAIAIQNRLMDLSPAAPSLGAALSHSALNMANASGAWLGGLVLAAGWGQLAPSWVGLALTAAGAGLFALAWAPFRPKPIPVE